MFGAHILPRIVPAHTQRMQKIWIIMWSRLHFSWRVFSMYCHSDARRSYSMRWSHKVQVSIHTYERHNTWTKKYVVCFATWPHIENVLSSCAWVVMRNMHVGTLCNHFNARNSGEKRKLFHFRVFRLLPRSMRRAPCNGYSPTYRMINTHMQKIFCRSGTMDGIGEFCWTSMVVMCVVYVLSTMNCTSSLCVGSRCIINTDLRTHTLERAAEKTKKKCSQKWVITVKNWTSKFCHKSKEFVHRVKKYSQLLRTHIQNWVEYFPHLRRIAPIPWVHRIYDTVCIVIRRWFWSAQLHFACDSFYGPLTHRWHAEFESREGSPFKFRVMHKAWRNSVNRIHVTWNDRLPSARAHQIVSSSVTKRIQSVPLPPCVSLCFLSSQILTIRYDFIDSISRWMRELIHALWLVHRDCLCSLFNYARLSG